MTESLSCCWSHIINMISQGLPIYHSRYVTLCWLSILSTTDIIQLIMETYDSMTLTAHNDEMSWSDDSTSTSTSTSVWCSLSGIFDPQYGVFFLIINHNYDWWASIINLVSTILWYTLTMHFSTKTHLVSDCWSPLWHDLRIWLSTLLIRCSWVTICVLSHIAALEFTPHLY